MPKRGQPDPRGVNYALKLAIWTSGRSQQEVARLALIEPQKLSHAVYGRRSLGPIEQKRLAKTLGRTVEEIFPPDLPVLHKSLEARIFGVRHEP